jgi:pimeloyl-ACP methyl ester carboxylesterase
MDTRTYYHERRPGGLCEMAESHISSSANTANRATRTIHLTRGNLAGLCLVLLMALPLWNLAVTKWRHAHTRVPGNFYSVDGRQMHVDCSGAGSPTVVMEQAASATWLEWRRVQPNLSQITRVCSYDRAGHGWSQPRTRPRDAEAIVRELHSLLDAAGVDRPFVLAGHSAGALYVREYAREFPSELAGAALIDASSPQQIDELPGWRASYEQDKHDQARELFWDQVKVWSGWDRLLGRCRVTTSLQDRPFVTQYQAMACRPAYVDTDESELNDFESSSRQAARLTTFGRIPLLIISQDPDLRTPRMTTTQLAEKPIWAHEQEQLKSLSPLSWRIVARGSGHMVPLERPDIVTSGITRLVGFLRGGPAPPFGATEIE